VARVGEMVARLIDAGLAICSIFGEGGSWGGRIDSGGSRGVVFNVSNRFGAPLAGRFFFGFRPRLLGIGKQYAPRLNNTASTAAARRHPPSRFAWGAGNTPAEILAGAAHSSRRSSNANSLCCPVSAKSSDLWRQIQMDFGPDGFRG
jgi:hypothetical protein